MTDDFRESIARAIFPEIGEAYASCCGESYRAFDDPHSEVRAAAFRAADEVLAAITRAITPEMIEAGAEVIRDMTDTFGLADSVAREVIAAVFKCEELSS